MCEVIQAIKTEGRAEGRKEEENIKLFKKQINKVLKVLKN